LRSIEISKRILWPRRPMEGPEAIRILRMAVGVTLCSATDLGNSGNGYIRAVRPTRT
jgi:hypothetical protein